MLTSSSKTSYSYARRILALPVLSLSILLFAFKLSNDHKPTGFLHANTPFTLVVDAGHGGTNPGASGTMDATEKDINLSIAKKVADLAPQYGITVKMTRTEDVTVSQEDRMNFIKKEQPDACISVHVNGTEEKLTSKDAFQVYITKNNTGENYKQSRLLGSSLIQSVKINFPVDADIMQRGQGIYVLDQNPYPSVILECGYMNNPESVQQLTTNAGIEKVAKDILEGVVAYANNRQAVSVATSDTIGKEPLYMVDGKEISADEMKKLDTKDLESVNVLKEKEAVKIYGENGKNGVVMITSKSSSKTSPKPVHIRLDGPPADTTIVPLYIVDGKEMPKEKLGVLSPDNIISINVLKNDDAIRQYGEKGKNGVVIISTIKKSASPSDINDKPLEKYEKTFITTDESPSFPGGNEAWIKYLQRNLRADVPAENKAPKGTYTVIVSFEVDEEGNISHFKAIKDPGYGTAAEAIRVIQRGPKWIPAKQNGKVVAAEAKQSITFSITG